MAPETATCIGSVSANGALVPVWYISASFVKASTPTAHHGTAHPVSTQIMGAAVVNAGKLGE